MKLLISTRGTLQKALKSAPDGAPTVRLHASGTRVDLTGDKVYDEVLQRWVDQAEAGKVMLLDNHHAAFPCGKSFGAEIVQTPEGSRELFIEFWLDTAHPMTPTILSQLGGGYEAQCSVGIVTPPGIPVREKGYDPEAGTVVGMIKRGDLEHVAFTRPNDAAYQYSDVDSFTAKSLEDAMRQMPLILKALDEKAIAEKGGPGSGRYPAGSGASPRSGGGSKKPSAAESAERSGDRPLTEWRAANHPTDPSREARDTPLSSEQSLASNEAVRISDQARDASDRANRYNSPVDHADAASAHGSAAAHHLLAANKIGDAHTHGRWHRSEAAKHESQRQAHRAKADAQYRGEKKALPESTDKSAPTSAQENIMKFAAKLHALNKAREEMCKAIPSAQKEDMTMALKAAHQHLAALKAVGEEVMGDEAATPEEIKAMLQHIIGESATIADVLSQHLTGEETEAGETPEHEAAEPPAVEAAEHGEEKAGPATPPPAAPVLEQSEKGAPASPGAPVAPGAAAPAGEPVTPAAAPAEAHGKTEKDEMAMALKSMQDSLDKLTKAREDDAKLIKSLGDQVEKYKATPDLRGAPAVSNLDPAVAEQNRQGGASLLKSLNPSTRDAASRALLTQALVEALGGMADDSGAR